MPDIQANIARDQDLDYPVKTNLTAAQLAALDGLAKREHQGNRAAAIRAGILTQLRSRYLLAE